MFFVLFCKHVTDTKQQSTFGSGSDSSKGGSLGNFESLGAATGIRKAVDVQRQRYKFGFDLPSLFVIS